MDEYAEFMLKLWPEAWQKTRRGEKLCLALTILLDLMVLYLLFMPLPGQ